GFNGLRVLALESRRATEVSTLIEKYGGRPMTAPALRELPLESNAAALDFGAGLVLGEFDIVIFLTGVGARVLFDVLTRAHPGDEIHAALCRTKVAVRGSKPASVLRELNVPVWAFAPEPNTWRELLTAMEARTFEQPIGGARIAVQEYGVPNQELLEALSARGASVLQVPVYRWALPDDLQPLRRAVAAIAGGGVDVLLLTSGVQLSHLWQVVEMMGCEAKVRYGLASTLIASIGPTTTEEIVRRRLTPDLEASHPKLGFLIREAADYASAHAKRAAARTI
ncbi:MAG: uroporphyrinogen-III synthase, partial [Vicinamibacterales bacterium]